jgi:hypothetical protein
MKNYKMERLLSGETITTKEKGNSMVPLIHSNQEHVLAPLTNWEDAEIGDILYCRLPGNRHYTHLVTAKDPKRGLQISNNKGHVNGWTKVVYGKVIEVLPL